jgi:hypothetical protein
VIWDLFMTLHRRRSVGFSSPNPISYTELQAFAAMFRMHITPTIADWVIGLDDCFLAAIAEKDS